MRIFKLISKLALITAIALVYVHQQVELVKLGYAIDAKEAILKEMLDQRERLSYNINNLEAPSRLEKTLQAKKIDIGFPKRAQVFKASALAHGGRERELARTVGLERGLNIMGILEFFSFGREAQAKEK